MLAAHARSGSDQVGPTGGGRALPIPLKVTLEARWERKHTRLWHRLQWDVGDANDWILATDEHFTLFLKRAVLPTLREHLRSHGEYLRPAYGGNVGRVAYAHHRRGAVKTTSLLSALETSAEAAELSSSASIGEAAGRGAARAASAEVEGPPPPDSNPDPKAERPEGPPGGSHASVGRQRGRLLSSTLVELESCQRRRRHSRWDLRLCRTRRGVSSRTVLR